MRPFRGQHRSGRGHGVVQSTEEQRRGRGRAAAARQLHHEARGCWVRRRAAHVAQVHAQLGDHAEVGGVEGEGVGKHEQPAWWGRRREREQHGW